MIDPEMVERVAEAIYHAAPEYRRVPHEDGSYSLDHLDWAVASESARERARRQARAGLAALWRPIETMPAGPGDFMLGCARRGLVNRAFRLPGEGELVMIGGRWRPTHWAPLLPPQAAS